MAWAILFLAGLFEIAWAVGLKYSQGLTRVVPTIFTLVCLVISMTLLAFALKTLPVGTAYGVWTGIGALGTAICGIVLFQESKEFWRILFLVLILAGIIGLKLTSK